VAALGLTEQGIRLPLTWLAPEHVNRVTDAMRHAGLEPQS
jgi:hypothetical protein